MTRVTMKTIAPVTLLLAWLAACGGKPAQSPENAEGSDGGAAASASADTPAKAESPEPSSSAPVPGDEGSKKKTACAGLDIPDLASVLSQAACEVGAAKDGAQPKDMKDALEVKVQADSPKIAPGSSATITVTFHNKSKADLPLDFIVDPEPRFDFEVYTVKGSRVDAPKGKAPSLPPEVANAPAPDQKIARVTLATNGTARLTLKWDAVKYKWASKDRAKGALPGQGYPKDPAGPLTKGKYVLRVVMPLTGVAEGSEHEVSQPRVPVEVGTL
jgi:hypothetical protein